MQVEMLTLLENLPSIEIIREETSTDSDTSDKQFLNTPYTTDTRCKTKVGDKTATILLTRCPDSGPDTDSSPNSHTTP